MLKPCNHVYGSPNLIINNILYKRLDGFSCNFLKVNRDPNLLRVKEETAAVDMPIYTMDEYSNCIACLF